MSTADSKAETPGCDCAVIAIVEVEKVTVTVAHGGACEYFSSRYIQILHIATRPKLKGLLITDRVLCVSISSRTMSNNNNHNNPDPLLTTNEEDQAEAAKLTARLAETNYRSTQTLPSATSASPPVPSVSLDDGAHKYVLIQAEQPATGDLQHFVISRRGAGYHRNVAEPTVYLLEQRGYRSIEITGGGRILLDDDKKKISIFGFSYGFGQADHAISKEVIEEDERYQGYDITISNEGY